MGLGYGTVSWYSHISSYLIRGDAARVTTDLTSGAGPVPLGICNAVASWVFDQDPALGLSRAEVLNAQGEQLIVKRGSIRDPCLVIRR